MPEVRDLVRLIHTTAPGLILLDLFLQLSVSSPATPQITHTPEVAVKTLHLGLFVGT